MLGHASNKDGGHEARSQSNRGQYDQGAKIQLTQGETMNTTICYATCKGETVRVKELGYATPKYFYQYKLMDADMPVKTVRYIQSSGGGYPTEYAYLAGLCACGSTHFVERRIDRPSFSRNHKCDARCQNATGRKCECACQGKNHGAN